MPVTVPLITVAARKLKQSVLGITGNDNAYWILYRQGTILEKSMMTMQKELVKIRKYDEKENINKS